MRTISKFSPVVAALVIVLLFSPLGASQVQVDVDVDVDEPRLQSLDATRDNPITQQQQQQAILKEYLESSKGSGTTIESNDSREESQAIGSGPGRPNEESSIPLPLHINETEEATTRYQQEDEAVDVNVNSNANDDRSMDAASPENDQQQNAQAETLQSQAHASDDSDKDQPERQVEDAHQVENDATEESVQTESSSSSSSIDQDQTHTTSPEEQGVVDTTNTKDNRQEASEEGATDSQQDESPEETASHDTIVEDDAARAEPIHESTMINEDSNSTESSGEEATRENISSGDGEDGPHTESIPEQHAVNQDVNSNTTSDEGDVTTEHSSDEVPTIDEAEPSIQRSHDEGATTESSPEAQSETTAGTEDMRHEPEVDKESTATEQIQEATVDEAVKPEDVESDIIDFDDDDDDIGGSGNTAASDGEPADDADANPSSVDDPTPTSDEKDIPGEKDPVVQSEAAPKGSLADFFNKVNKNKAPPSGGKEKPQAAASNSFENMATLAQQTHSVHQESPPPPPKKPAPLEEKEYGGTWGLFLQNERPADLDLLYLVFQDNLNRMAGGSFESKVNEARFPLGMGSDDEENETDVILQREGATRIKKSVNSEFVEGLDDIDKFFEGVDPPDELDVGAGGSSIQEVLMGQGRQILFKRIALAFQKIRRAVVSTKNKIGSTWTSLVTRFSSEDGKFTVKKEDFGDAAKGLWNVCVAVYRLVVKFIDDLLEGDDGSDDLDDFELDFKSKINLRDPALNLDLGKL